MAASVSDILKKNDTECANAVSAFKRDLKKVRTGRATAGLVEGIQVDYYGSKTAVSHLAQISVPEPRLIVIQAYDPQAVQSIEKAIQNAGLGFNPARDGNLLRVLVPPLTEESRRDIVKHLNKMAEDIRISIRNHRRDANELVKKLEKDSVVNKDDAKKASDGVQKQVDKYVAEVDALLKAKEAECLEV